MRHRSRRSRGDPLDCRDQNLLCARCSAQAILPEPPQQTAPAARHQPPVLAVPGGAGLRLPAAVRERGVRAGKRQRGQRRRGRGKRPCEFPLLMTLPRIIRCFATPIYHPPLYAAPFEAPHHRSAVLAAILSLLARYAVGHVPLFAIRATTRGSGKTLLADAISVIATGQPAAKMPQARDEDEERKRLLAIALAGDPLVVIDNVTGDLGTPALDVALTSLTFKDRLLGKNKTKEAPLETVFLATGNQMSFRGDTARRVVPIDLLPDVERPEERTGFAHPDLLAYLTAHRPLLVAAALTLLRAYVVAGRPPQGLTAYGSFEAWSDLIRAALVWAGQPDPCLGRVGLEASSDAGYEGLAELLEAWHACYGEQPTTLKTVFRQLTMYEQESDYQRLQEAIEGFCDTGKQEKKSRREFWGTCSKKWKKGSSTANTLRIKAIAVEMAKSGG